MSINAPARLTWLDPRRADQPFPDPALALPEPNGLLAVGGDLSSVRLLNAYRSGIFPWFNPDEPILWWSPDPRCVLIPGRLRLSHSLAKRQRQAHFAISFDRVFGQVIEACAGSRKGARGTWLGPDMRRAYLQLHAQGHAHSVEVWRQGQLIGGLYGLAIGGGFFGESMFSRETDASKLALAALSAQLGDWGYGLIDAQVTSPHLLSLGAMTLPRAEFLRRLAAALKQPARGDWQFSAAHFGDPAQLPP